MRYARGCGYFGAFVGVHIGVIASFLHDGGFAYGLLAGALGGPMLGLVGGFLAALAGELKVGLASLAGLVLGLLVAIAVGSTTIFLNPFWPPVIVGVLLGWLIGFILCLLCARHHRLLLLDRLQHEVRT
jgi:hypothetical protein